MVVKNQEYHNTLGVILQVRAMETWTLERGSGGEGGGSPISVFPTWLGAVVVTMVYSYAP